MGAHAGSRRFGIRAIRRAGTSSGYLDRSPPLTADLSVGVLLTDTQGAAHNPGASDLHVPSHWKVASCWAEVDTDLVVLLRTDDTLHHDVASVVTAAFSEPDVTVAWPSSADEPRSRPAGRYRFEEAFADVVEAQAMGPVAIRRQSVPEQLRSTSLRFEPLLAVRSGVTVVTEQPFIDSPAITEAQHRQTDSSWRNPARLRPFGHRRRWHDPGETEQWISAVDSLALRGHLDIDEELAVTAALLRRIVLFPDLAELGPFAAHGVLVIDALAARLESLIAGERPERHRPALGLIDVDCDLEELTPAPWWVHESLGDTPIRKVYRSSLLAGPETDDAELDRFKVNLGDGQ